MLIVVHILAHSTLLLLYIILVDVMTLGGSFSPKLIKRNMDSTYSLFIKLPFVIYGSLVSADNPVSQKHCKNSLAHL